MIPFASGAGMMSLMRCSALTAKGEPCKSKASSDTGYCHRHKGAISAPADASSAERRLREETPHIVARVRLGSSPISAFGASGYTARQARTVLAIAAGGEAEVTDEGYRHACEQVAAMMHGAQSERDGELAAAWREHALKDWRAAKEFLERRSPDEWTATQQISVDADVRTEGRSEDAVLAALAKLTGGGSGGGSD